MEYGAILIDAMNLAYRSWWPVRELKTSEGMHSGLEFGFLKNMLSLTREATPAKVILAWDGRPKRGLDLYPEYKAGRNKDMKDGEPPWDPRLERLKRLLSTVVESLYHPEMEADDQIARMVKLREGENRTTAIVSNDADMFQLVSNLTHVKKDRNYITPTEVQTEYGVPPEKMILVRAVSGDRSDNIPGIPRIASKTKVRLASKANSLDELVKQFSSDGQLTSREREKLEDGVALVRRNYEIMDLRSQPPEPTIIAPVTGEVKHVLEFCKSLELNSLLNRKEWFLFKGREEWELPKEVVS